MLSADLMQQLANLEGLISPEVGLRLAHLASVVPRNTAIVEIGSYKGKSTCYLAAGALAGNGALVHAVDPWDLPGNVGGRFGFDQRSTRADFLNQVRAMGLQKHIIPWQDFSVRRARTWRLKPIGLLYIDGSHTEVDVRADWTAWSRFLIPKAFVAFDDYDTKNNPGVKRVVDSLKIELPGSTWHFGPAPLIVGELP